MTTDHSHRAFLKFLGFGAATTAATAAAAIAPTIAGAEQPAPPPDPIVIEKEVIREVPVFNKLPTTNNGRYRLRPDFPYIRVYRKRIECGGALGKSERGEYNEIEDINVNHISISQFKDWCERKNWVVVEFGNLKLKFQRDDREFESYINRRWGVNPTNVVK